MMNTKSRLKKEKRFPKNLTIVEQGSIGTTFYMIQSGSAQVSIQDEEKNDTVVAELHAGDYFGEQALMNQKSRRAASIKTMEPTVCLTLDYDAFEQLFSSKKLNVQFAHRRAIAAERMGKMTVRSPKAFEKTMDQKIQLARAMFIFN